MQNLIGMSAKETEIGQFIEKLKQAINNEDEYELHDIFEYVNHQNIKQVVTNNILYILKREKLVAKSWSVVIPEGAYDYKLAKDDVRFGGDFEIFSDPMTIVAYGSVVTDGDNNNIIRMEINITRVVGYPKTNDNLMFF